MVEDAKLIERTIKFVYDLYIGKLDKKGNADILHPLSVGMKGKNTNEILVGLLHDVVEDGMSTFEELSAMGIPSEAIEALKLLTHDKASTTYYDYVQSIVDSGNPIAIAVKRNDLVHNISRGTAETRKKHYKALDMILKCPLGLR